jgi:hypothetical protein
MLVTDAATTGHPNLGVSREGMLPGSGGCSPWLPLAAGSVAYQWYASVIASTANRYPPN